jgi:hypothetical protein
VQADPVDCGKVMTKALRVINVTVGLDVGRAVGAGLGEHGRTFRPRKQLRGTGSGVE